MATLGVEAGVATAARRLADQPDGFRHRRLSVEDRGRRLDGGHADGAKRRHGRSIRPGLGSYNGMFPCLRFGPGTRFVWSVSSARISLGRVSCGTITSSM